MKYYILENKVPVPISSGNRMEDVIIWGQFFGNDSNRIIQHHHFGEILVSTIFLGLDHNYFGGPPLLFETMIFPNEEFKYYQERYSTWDESMQGHLKAVKYVVPIWRRKMNFDFALEVIITIIVSLFFLVFGLFLVVIL